MWKLRIRFLQSVFMVAFLSWTGSSSADEALEVSNDVRIEAATATPARRGGSTKIHFVLINDSSSRLHLSKLTSPIARKISLLARTSPTQTAEIGSIGVSSGERLDLTTSHLWYEALPVSRDLKLGETIDVTLNFVTWELTVPVHVHASGPQS